MDAQASEKTQKSRAILGRSGVNGVVTDHIQVFLITIFSDWMSIWWNFWALYHDFTLPLLFCHTLFTRGYGLLLRQRDQDLLVRNFTANASVTVYI